MKIFFLSAHKLALEMIIPNMVTFVKIQDKQMCLSRRYFCIVSFTSPLLSRHDNTEIGHTQQ